MCIVCIFTAVQQLVGSLQILTAAGREKIITQDAEKVSGMECEALSSCFLSSQYKSNLAEIQETHLRFTDTHGNRSYISITFCILTSHLEV